MYETNVETRIGKLKGRAENGVRIFKGVPYAKPPVGELRFREPQRMEAWEGERDAFQFGPVCPQPVGVLPQSEGVQKSENCLYLNVYAPEEADGDLPVMVWIHGGAFYLGAGSEPLYDGTQLARQGKVIVVTINYRLGPFGFLHLSSIDDSYSSNLGLLDQIAALEWVKENIAFFGGDRHHITVFGESAGSMSIASLLAMPKAKGLFQKAIMESGASATMSKKLAKAAAESFLSILNIDTNHMERLRDVSDQELLQAADQLRAVMGENIFELIFLPVVDEKNLPMKPETAVAKGAAKEINLLIGTNLDEGALFFTPDSDLLPQSKINEILEEYVGKEAAETAAPLYPRSLEGHVDMMTDLIFWHPSIVFASAQSRHASVFMYRFDWHTDSEHPPFNKAAHGLEIPFVFGKIDSLEQLTGTKASEEAELLAKHIQAAWLSFARSGNPSTDHVSWPDYDEDSRKTLIFDQEIAIESDPYSEKRKMLTASNQQV
ncbi:carboxylesterase/lipase family protein [Bacillus haynesii]|uniref:carboxylesterase/lipase family protein n=1 Tax=Bacillus haynesii TaxID=1925021 RepID=UPI002DB6D676|nr:carboxylesterase/lipase family protein [Bacillus haynesii]MEC1449018.1 carboxylesterase/lipase family protein [Bacillus haynesii]